MTRIRYVVLIILTYKTWEKEVFQLNVSNIWGIQIGNFPPGSYSLVNTTTYTRMKSLKKF